MTTATQHRLAAGLLAATGLLHLVLVPEYAEEKGYIGVLFVVGGLASLAVAARLWKSDGRADWLLATALAGGMAFGFVLSRTVGLPGFHPTDWELDGILSVLIEAGVVALAVPRLLSAGSTGSPARA